VDNADVIRSLYEALQRRDGVAMGSCYAPEARFEDAVFTLSGWEVPAMWRMLCERATDLRVEFRDVQAIGDSGSAHVEAWYTFSATGRSVHNVIDAAFTFRDGKITSHRDRFDFHRWATQALGWRGRLLGWMSFLQDAVRRRSAASLKAYAEKHRPQGAP
jgi:ketosteroid isomerase-like protein